MFLARSTLDLPIDLCISKTWTTTWSVHDAGACRPAPAPLSGFLPAVDVAAVPGAVAAAAGEAALPCVAAGASAEERNRGGRS